YKVEAKNTSVVPGLQPAQTSSAYATTDTLTFNEYDSSTDSIADSGLNPRYVFDGFIVGKTNELANAAALAVATQPGTTYNPLFIYGGSGLGKTHLLHAIGNHLSKTDPDKKVLYVTSERFTNDFIHSIRGGKGKEFKDLYRNVDVLLVDDIQFISGKESTQEEFFHTFNALHQANKQLVLSSDRQPKDIQAIENRLQTRMEWGMMADISSPDFETRVAILGEKIKEKGAELSLDIQRYIAGTVQSNVRELEGALNKILAYHQFKNTLPTLETVQSLLQSYIPSVPKRNITPRRLMEIVVIYYDITLDELMGKSREQRLAYPRQIAMYLLRHEAKCSFPAIGEHVGGRDHTTAMHACTKIAGLAKNDEQLKRDLSLLREKLYSTGGGG
ncbi:MAG: chromosomal replication initiator protein DnaA, partial [Patescibacteria group bacterium]